MSSPAIPNPLPPNDTRGPNLLAIYWVQTGIAIVVVALRFYVRYAKRIIGVEDWAMLGCLVCTHFKYSMGRKSTDDDRSCILLEVLYYLS